MQVRDESKYIKFIHLIWFFKINWENKLIYKVMNIVVYLQNYVHNSFWFSFPWLL